MDDSLILVVNPVKESICIGTYYEQNNTYYIITSNINKNGVYLGCGKHVLEADFSGEDKITGIALLKPKKPIAKHNGLVSAYSQTETCLFHYTSILGNIQKTNEPSLEPINGSPYMLNNGSAIAVHINGKRIEYAEVVEAVNRILKNLIPVTVGAIFEPFDLFYSAVYSGGLVENIGLVVVDVTPEGPFHKAGIVPGTILVSPLTTPSLSAGGLQSAGRLQSAGNLSTIEYGNKKPNEILKCTFYGGTVKNIILNELNIPETSYVEPPCFQALMLKSLKTRAQLKQ